MSLDRTRATGSGRQPSPLFLLFLVPILTLVWACSPGASISPPASSSPPPASGVASPSEASLAPSATAPSGAITLYTSVQQPVVDAVLGAYRAAQPGVDVELFRAPTGELSARIAAELRAGTIGGDVLWLTDPISMQAWASQNVLRTWTPANLAGLDPADRTDTFWGTRILNMVIVSDADVTPAPVTWADLASPVYKDAVAIADPGFAGSAYGALGYFALTPGYGLDFFRDLKANGAVQVKSPDEVTTGVAERRFKAGITLDSSVRAAVAKGSPVTMVWPSGGAIAMYGPVAVVGATDNAPAAESFVEFLLSGAGQKVLGGVGQEPVRPDSGGPEPDGPQIRPDWPAIFSRGESLLDEYRDIFGG